MLLWLAGLNPELPRVEQKSQLGETLGRGRIFCNCWELGFETSARMVSLGWAVAPVQPNLMGPAMPSGWQLLAG